MRPRITDLIVYRNDVKMFRGRIAPYSTSYDPDNMSTSFQAVSYKGILDRRILYDADCTTDPGDGSRVRRYGTGGGTGISAMTDVADIAWNLINRVQTVAIPRPAGCELGITPGENGFTAGIGNTGCVRSNIDFSPGMSILECLTKLMAGTESTTSFENEATGLPAVAVATEGADWDIDADLKLQIWPLSTGGRGSATPVWVADYGGSVAAGSVSSDPTKYATRLRVSSGTSGIAGKPVNRLIDAPDVIIAAQGLWETQLAAGNRNTQKNLDTFAAEQLKLFTTYRASYNLELAPEMWNASTVLGDMVTILMPTVEGLQSEQARINSEGFAIDNESNEKVTLTLGDKPTFTARSAAAKVSLLGQRIRDIETVLFSR